MQPSTLEESLLPLMPDNLDVSPVLICGNKVSQTSLDSTILSETSNWTHH
jgi:hypothetical protein